jgi:hypothetical protein
VNAFVRRWAWPGGILAGALVLRLLLFTGIQGNDDLIYSEAAWRLWQGDSPFRDNLLATRVGFTAPLAVLYGIFGVHPWGLAMPAFISSLLLVWIAWRFGRDHHSEAGGIGAALFVAMMPLDVFLATSGFLDGPLAALLGGGAYLLWSASRGEAWLGRSIAAGLLWGWAYLVKESALPLILPALPFVVTRERWRATALALGTVGAVFAVEALAYGVALGDALHRVHLAHRAQLETASSGEGLVSRVFAIPSFLLNPLGIGAAYTAGLALLCVAGWVSGHRQGRKRMLSLGIWWLGGGFLLALAPITLWPYRPAVMLQPRMMAVMTLPGALLAGALAEGWLRGARARGVVGVAAATLALAASVRLHADAVGKRWGVEWAADVLARHRGARVISDPRTIVALRMLSGYVPPWDLRGYREDLPIPEPGVLLLRNPALAGQSGIDGVRPPAWWDGADPPRAVIDERRRPAPWRLRGSRGPDGTVSISRVDGKR